MNSPIPQKDRIPRERNARQFFLTLKFHLIIQWPNGRSYLSTCIQDNVVAQHFRLNICTYLDKRSKFQVVFYVIDEDLSALL